ncbi:hypothetical protein CARUB_v10025647mg [Capsella rubella]|uniref:Uncharacterized protein n=1 Tax=Capsella rubella TaxID=81985 RepID=R0G241_9BRAS|nr:probable inactive leucine-rich repeat receptor kinase XIAO [Capsella rubella]EOA29361.1 hypothetical protein CARUB_v10025647mg [Capsella rubella]
MDLKLINLRLRPSFFIIFSLVLILLLKDSGFGAAANPKCISTERQALLTFKALLTDLSGRLFSWSGPDCCNWPGVLCDTRTSRVVKIDLRNPVQDVRSDEYKRSCLRGKLHPSLTSLKFLSYLDLSSNDFGGLEIPGFLGQIVTLRYLNLSSSSFSGEIPANLENLSKLESLDLNAESFGDSGTFSLRASNLGWISGLSSSLKYLNMGYVNLSSAGETWLENFSRVTTLKELRLFNCEIKKLPLLLSSSASLKHLEVLDLSETSLNSPIPSWLFGLTNLRKLSLRWCFLEGSIPTGFKNLKLLETLDLSNNLALQGEIPSVLGDLSRLKFLDLSANELNGQINGFLDAYSRRKGNSLEFLDLSSNKLVGTLPESLGTLRNLQILDLSSNSFTGSIPSSIGNMASLKKLDLSYNAMNGSIPESLGKLAELVDLNLMANTWEGVLLKSHFVNLKSLKTIRLTTEPYRSLIFKLPSTWVPPFRLESIQIENCQIGLFSMWLQVQTKLNFITLRNTGIEDTIPDSWFSGISSEVTYLVLANNRIKGRLPQNLAFPKLNTIDLSSNNFEGPFPLWSTNATELRLYENNFSGSLPQNIDVLMPGIQKIYLFHNSFTGKIPSSLCDISGLQILSLRKNHFSGSFPNCWHRQFMLWGIDASENNLSGEIPAALSLLPSLSVLLLNQNALEGKIPESLQNCSGLTSIDLGGNKLTGKLPSWVGKLSSLFMLRLQSNSFTGPIPDELCSVPNLRILDLSGNKISGPIPKCISNLTAIARGTNNEVFENLVFIVTRAREYQDIVNSINLSGNNISGRIPGEILGLSYLRILNLSRNSMAGSIPEKISELSRLEALDLSRNKFSGAIPQSLAAISSLQKLNLSFNKLEGSIPKLLKFQDPSIYTGNELLCGKPLPKKCPKDINSKML